MKARVIERQKGKWERGRVEDLPTANLLPKLPKWPAKARSFILGSHMSGKNPSSWAAFHCFPKETAGNWMGTRRARIWTSTNKGCGPHHAMAYPAVSQDQPPSWTSQVPSSCLVAFAKVCGCQIGQLGLLWHSQQDNSWDHLSQVRVFLSIAGKDAWPELIMIQTLCWQLMTSQCLELSFQKKFFCVIFLIRKRWPRTSTSLVHRKN